MTDAPRSRLRSSVFVALAVLLGIAVLEGVARLAEAVWPPLPVDYSLGVGADSILFVPVPGYPGYRQTRPDKLAFFDEQTFAATKPAGTVRVALLGGSAVLYAREVMPGIAASLSERLGKPTEVINAGGASYGTNRIQGVLAELLNYELDAVLLYSGHNEFEEMEQLHLGGGGQRVASTLAQAALYRFLRDAVVAVRVRGLAKDHDARTGGDGPDLSRA